MARVEAYWRRESLTYLTDGKVGKVLEFCFFVLVLVPCLECAFLAAARVCTGCVARRLAVGFHERSRLRLGCRRGGLLQVSLLDGVMSRGKCEVYGPLLMG